MSDEIELALVLFATHDPSSSRLRYEWAHAGGVAEAGPEEAMLRAGGMGTGECERAVSSVRPSV